MRLFLLTGVLFATFTGFAQDYRFGRVEKSDFETTTTAGEELPSAEVLYKKEHVDFLFVQGVGFLQQRSVHERIKINNEEGLEYATKKVRLYNKDNSTKESLEKLKGYTYQLKNGDLEKTKLRGSGEFQTDINEYWKLSSFTMPEVQIGSIIEYEYIIESPFMTIDDLILQYDIPIHELDVRVEMLEYYTYNVLFNPRASFVPKIDKSFSQDNLKITTKNTSTSGRYGQNRSTSFGSEQYQMRNQVLGLKTKNIPALKPEPMSGSLSRYRAKIIFELAAVQLPQQKFKRLSADWESVTKSIFDLQMFGDQLQKRPFYEDELSAHLEDSTTNDQKAKKILAFVQNSVKWNGYYGITSQKGIREAFKEGSGNIADINLLLTSMLNSQGVEAYPILISTRDNGVPLFPTREGFNYVAVIAKINGGDVLMDATDLNLPIGRLKPEAMNWQGRVVKSSGSSSWIDLSPLAVAKEMVMTNVEFNKDLSLKGNIVKRFTGDKAYIYRKDHRNNNKEAVKEFLKDGYAGLQISNLEIKEADNPEKPIGFSYDVSFDNAAEQIGDKVYITPLLNEANVENPFQLEDRKLPVVFNHPLATQTVVNIDIPEDYSVVSLPDSVEYTYKNGAGTYRFIISQNAHKITALVNFQMKDLEVLPNEYEAWKNFFTSIISKESEKIVLKKI